MTVKTQAFILHRFAYQEADLILKVLTKDHGIISILAKGIRRSKTKTQGCFEPFVPLEITYFGKNDLKKLKSIEMRGAYFSLKAERLYAAFYLNELLMYLIPPSFSAGTELERIFEHYEKALGALAVSALEPILLPVLLLETVLREFEIVLLTSLGVWPDLSRDEKGGSIDPESFYELVVEHLPKKIISHDAIPNAIPRGGVFHGDILLGIFSQHWEQPGVLSAAKKLLRHWISYYCDGKPFKSRECFRAL